MRVFNFAHPLEGLYQSCGMMQTAGSAFNWFSKVFKGNIDGVSMEELNRLAAASVPGANGVLFLPYLLGECSSLWDRQAKEEFIGIFGCEIKIPKLLTEASSMGAALLGGVGTGIYSDFSMVEKMNPVVKQIQPNNELFPQAYTSLTDLFTVMGRP